MTAIENLGPHLLGRNPHPGDERDYPLEVFLAGGTPLDAALAAMKRSSIVSKTVKRWATLVTQIIEQAPPPAPAPAPTPDPTPTPDPPPDPPTPTDVDWPDTDPVLDQGQSPHCVGFGGADWMNTQPVDDHADDAGGHTLYYQCKINEGEVGQENGTTVHALAQVLRENGRLKTYAWATDINTMTAWLDGHGPVIVGTDWENDMFSPDPSGFVTPTGGIAGGHCYVAVGYHPSHDAIEFLNSWGPDWALNGRFFMRTSDVADLLGRPGAEAMAAVELPTAA